MSAKYNGIYQKTDKPEKNKTPIKIVSVGLIICIILCVVGCVFLKYVPIFDDNMNIETNDFDRIAGEFTNVLVTDGDSAMLAAQEASALLGLGNAADELTVSKISTVGDLSYYRLQQNYQRMPFVGRTMIVIASTDGKAQGFLSNAINVPNEVDITIDLDEDNIVLAVAKYSGKNEDDIEIIECEKIIFDNFARFTTPELCYYVTAKTTGEEEYYCSVIISAKDKKVLYNDVALNPAEICISSSDLEFSGSKNSSGEYILFDMERNFYCLDANGHNTYSFTNLNWIRSSATAIKSDTYTFDSKYDYVFETVQKIEQISDFYKSTFSDNGTEYFALVADCGTGTTGGLMPVLVSEDLQNIEGITDDVGVINLGSKDKESIADDVVTLAHEYTHVISNNNVHWVTGLDFANQTQAINEAYSDLFSMIINEKINSDGYIWNDGGRIDDVAKISETAYPTKIDSCKTKLISSEIGGGNGKEYCDVLWAVDNKGNEIAAYSYTNAVVLEYAAYLMTASGSSEENLTIDELADLWYCTMLTLPSNCTYSILRENMEMMAAIKGYSDEKRSNISSSFETIGVELQSQHLSTSFDLTVVDTDGIVCTDYTIEISGMKNTLWWSTEYAETITVDDENVKHIELPKGNYQLTITCKENDFSASRKISVTHSKNKNNSLVIVAEGTKTISQNEYIANQLIGEWSHDANKTYAETGIIVQNLFGSSIKYGSTMIFGTDGSFSYGIAAGIGGEGTFAVVDNKTVSYCITTYEEECAENGILTIDDSGEQIYLIMNYGDAKVYWSKKTGENGKEDTSFSTEETCSPNENNHSITITDDSSAEDLRKAIIGEWYDPNFAVNNYTFFENGSCKMMFSDAEPGTFEITADKTLKINMPWTTKKLKWDSNCLYSHVGWYFTSDGNLIIEGNILKRQ